MSGDDDFRVRPGSHPLAGKPAGIADHRPGARRGPACRRACLAPWPAIVAPGRSTFGRGRVASVRATHRLGHRSRQVIVKARVVRHGGRASLAAHLNYLQRDGVTRDGEKGVLFGSEAEGLDRNEFAARCEDDRHHFRFIVSPEDAEQMRDLKGFTRDSDGADGAAISARGWTGGRSSTGTPTIPHVHIIVRGVAEDVRRTSSSRATISARGCGRQAREIVTRELGPRTDLDIRQSLERQVEAERWTEIDRDAVRGRARARRA